MAEGDPGENKLCFVIGPIGDAGSDERRHADWLLEGIIIPVFVAHFPDFKLERADRIGTPGMITSQIISRLIEAPLVVADMSFHNANAFYELAIRHMLGLPTIHMIIKGSKIPFDVGPHRAIVFARDEYREAVQAQNDLKLAIDEAMKPEFQVENPVTHARGRLKLDRHASPEMKVVMDAIDSFASRLSKIEETHAAAERDAIVRALAMPAAGFISTHSRAAALSLLNSNSSIAVPPGPTGGSAPQDWTSSGWRQRGATDVSG
jgi:hypothetical protein